MFCVSEQECSCKNAWMSSVPTSVSYSDEHRHIHPSSKHCRNYISRNYNTERKATIRMTIDRDARGCRVAQSRSHSPVKPPAAVDEYTALATIGIH